MDRWDVGQLSAVSRLQRRCAALPPPVLSRLCLPLHILPTLRIIRFLGRPKIVTCMGVFDRWSLGGVCGRAWCVWEEWGRGYTLLDGNDPADIDLDPMNAASKDVIRCRDSTAPCPTRWEGRRTTTPNIHDESDPRGVHKRRHTRRVLL